MRRFLLRSIYCSAVVTFGAGLSWAQASKVEVAVLDNQSARNWEQVTASLQKCQACEFKNLTPYDEKGEFQRHKVAEALQLSSPPQIVYITFNELRSKENEIWIEKLGLLSQQGSLIIGAAGTSKDNELSHPLKDTFLVAVPDVLILGERSNRDVLPKSSYFGPEMLTALKEPMVDFLRPLAESYKKRSKDEWIGHFKQVKNSSRKLWLDSNDFFRRTSR